MHELLRKLFDPDYHPWVKVLGSWFGFVVASITLSKLVLIATFCLTCTQLFFLVRDKWWRDPQRKKRKHRR